jgi:hypothetical protein
MPIVQRRHVDRLAQRRNRRLATKYWAAINARLPPRSRIVSCSNIVVLCMLISTFFFSVSDKNYPNPPSWGVSWHINGFETPELIVQRGIEYTFHVMVRL